MANRILAAALAGLLALPAAAVRYKWTGAVSADFAEAGNWLVESEGAWVETETPPSNTYGVDTIVFDGDAESCPNQPVVSTDYMLRDIYFYTSGWTISGEGSIRLNHCFGGTDYTVDGVRRPNITYAVVDSSESGTNTISAAFYVTFGYTFNISGGGVLAITGKTNCDNGPGNNLGSNAKHSQKIGAGTLYLGGVGEAGKLTEKYMDVIEGTLVLGRVNEAGAGVATLTGTLHVRGTGKVEYLADNQVSDVKSEWWLLGGEGSIDFGGYNQTLAYIAFGVAAGDHTVAGDWTGTISNSENLRVGTANSNSSSYGYLQVNPAMSETVVLKDGLSSNCGRYNSNTFQQLYICASDNPNLDLELQIEGSAFQGRSGNNGVPVHYTKSHLADGTCGAIALACENGSSGQYAKVYVETILYVNSNESSTSSLGAPKIVEVAAETGVLRGDGLITPYTGSSRESIEPTIDIYGTLAPGSLANPAGTLEIRRSYAKNSVATTMHTGSVFRLSAAKDGSLPSVVQGDGSFILEQPVAEEAGEDAEETVVASAPKIAICGQYAPSAGMHRILSVTGSLEGAFAPEVEISGFRGAAKCTATVVYSTDGATTNVDLKISKPGFMLTVR